MHGALYTVHALLQNHVHNALAVRVVDQIQAVAHRQAAFQNHLERTLHFGVAGVVQSGGQPDHAGLADLTALAYNSGCGKSDFIKMLQNILSHFPLGLAQRRQL